MSVNSDSTIARFEFVQNGQQHSSTATIDYTNCHYGGNRPWFVCEACSNRCALLYIVAGDIACRSCNGLLYPSQKETDTDRTIRRAQNLGIRLGFGPNLVNGELLNRHKGPPEHMRQHTYDRLLAEYINARTRAIMMI